MSPAILLICAISFNTIAPDGSNEKRTYRATGIVQHLNHQFIGVDFSRWQEKYKVDLPWSYIKVNSNSCNVIRVYDHEDNIPEEVI